MHCVSVIECGVRFEERLTWLLVGHEGIKDPIFISIKSDLAIIPVGLWSTQRPEMPQKSHLPDPGMDEICTKRCAA